jgi:uncharacterized membrane protein
MLELIYSSLAAVGFTHPLHPSVTHLPMGMAMGAFFFQLASYKKEELAKTANYCHILALIFIPITALFGIMDWQHRYLGKTSNLIISKIALAISLTIIISITIYLYRKKKPGINIMTLLYLIAMLNAIPLGFIGGKLIFD